MDLLARRGARVATAAESPAFLPAHRDGTIRPSGGNFSNRPASARGEFRAGRPWPASGPAGISQLARETLAGLGEPPRRSSKSPSRSTSRRRLAIMKKLLNPPQVTLAGPPKPERARWPNALVGRQVSIVHEQRRHHADLGPRTGRPRRHRHPPHRHRRPVGLPDAPPDTAAGIDAEAIRRSRQAAQDADLSSCCNPPTPNR